MKKPIVIVFNDVHLKQGNEQAIIESVEHMIDYAIKNKIKDLILAGDLFDSRSFQRQKTLETFDIILTKINLAGITLHLFPGNHDKTVYEDRYSFLEVYKHHPCVQFNDMPKTIVIKGVSIELIPFFSDEILIPLLKESEGADILVSHFEMAGSEHLGKVSEKVAINRRLLKKWEKTYLGHYHNTHEITDDIVHLPSFRQTNFGEDSNKGFSVLYDDFSYHIEKGVFKEFEKLSIDMNTTSPEELQKLVEAHKNSQNSVRFEFTGSEEKLKALNKGQFAKTGIDIKLKYDAVEIVLDDLDMPTAPKPVVKYEKEQIEDAFHEFCAKKLLNYKKGKTLMEHFFENQ